MKPYLTTTLLYLFFGLAWIFFSDRIAESITSDHEIHVQLQTMKGWFYVSISGALIYYLSRRTYYQHIARQKDVLDVFQKTVEGTHHILLNYLNQMQLVRIEAESCADFDKEVLGIATQISREAERALHRLRQIETITTDNIEKVVYREILGNGADNPDPK